MNTCLKQSPVIQGHFAHRFDTFNLNSKYGNISFQSQFLGKEKHMLIRILSVFKHLTITENSLHKSSLKLKCSERWKAV